jgi:hypothetical protein
VVTYVVSAKGKECGTAESADRANDKEFPAAEMSEPEDITEEILRRPGDKEQKEHEKGPFVVQEIVILRHRLLFYEPLHKGPSECSGKQEGRQRTGSQSDRGKQKAKNRTIEKSSDEPCYFSWNRRGNDLQGLKKNKAEERDGAQRIEERHDPLPVHKELEGSCPVKDENQPKEEKKGRYSDPDVFVLSSCRCFYFSSLPGPLSRNAFIMSIGTGKMIVEFFSVAISVRVPRNLS